MYTYIYKHTRAQSYIHLYIHVIHTQIQLKLKALKRRSWIRDTDQRPQHTQKANHKPTGQRNKVTVTQNDHFTGTQSTPQAADAILRRLLRKYVLRMEF